MAVVSPRSEVSPLFLTTRWSVVLRAKDCAASESSSALETLCRDYWYPLYAYVRRAGHSPPDAQDLTQEFFARLLAKEWLLAVQPERGRFRTFLIITMKRFLANEWHRSMTQKRGGAQTHVPLDATDAEQRYACEPALAADEIYERRWAMTLLDQTLGALGAEFTAAGRAHDFEYLKCWLTAGRGEIPYAQLALQMQVSEGAARVAVHRLRKRFRELFRQQVQHTLADGEDVEAEMRHLVSVLSRA